MNILVTGGAGFIGSNLIDRLIKEKNKVTCLDNMQTGNIVNIEKHLDNPNFNFVRWDIKDSILNLKFHVDQIYHLACAASPEKYQKDPIDTMMTNVIGTKNMLDYAKHKNVRMLLTSTSEIYGEPLEHPQKETYRGNVSTIGPRANYDEGKRAAETLMYDYNRMYNVEVRVARIFNTYGPKMDIDDGRVVTNFIKQKMRGENFTIYGDGKQTRSLCYIDDQVDGLIKLMNSDYMYPVNIGNDREITVLELASVVHNVINSKEQIVYDYKDLPKDDPTRRCPDLTTAKKELNWKPETQLVDGILKTYKYFENKL